MRESHELIDRKVRQGITSSARMYELTCSCGLKLSGRLWPGRTTHELDRDFEEHYTELPRNWVYLRWFV